MNRKIVTSIVMTALFTVVLTSCEKEKENNKSSETGKPTPRYETVPYAETTLKNSGTDNLKYSCYDDEYNYYFFVLGYVKNVPLAYRDAYEYNGMTNITVKYARTDITQESIKNSVTKASLHSFTRSQSTTYGNEIGVKAEFPKILGTKLEASYKHSWGGSDGTSETNSRSFSNTYETSLSNTSSSTTEESFIIGNKGEPTGWYRWSLFSTCDVYFIVITDRAKTRIVEANTVFCARPSVGGWKLDYDPEEEGAFAKTAQGDLLQIPKIDLSQLPEPEEYISDISEIKESNLKIIFNDYKITATTSKDNFKHGVYQMGIEIGIEGEEKPLVKYPENGEYHNYGLYDDNLKNNKTVTRTYQIALEETKVKVPQNKSFYIKFKTHTEVEKYHWLIVAVFDGKEYSTGEKTIFFDYDSEKENWVARGNNTDSFVTFTSDATKNFTITHSMNYSIIKE